MEDGAQHIQDIPLSQLSLHTLCPYRVDKMRSAGPTTTKRQHYEPLQPVLVRPKNGRYEIIDGLNRYWAAMAANAAELPCRIVDYDDAATLRQLAIQYRSSIDDPLRLGQVLRELLALKSCSQDELAAAVSMSAGTVRNHLRYVDAFDRRRSHAGASTGTKASDTGPAADISRLTIAQVRTYLGLPAALCNIWLDAGAPLDAATASVLKGLKGNERLTAIVQHGWLDKLSRSTSGFAPSLTRLFACVAWLEQNTTIPTGKAYLQSVLDWDLPAEVLDCLPSMAHKGCWWSRLTPALWETILEECSELDLGTRELCARVRGRVDAALKTDKVPANDRASAEGQKAMNVLNAPEFIRSASCLTTDEKSLLASFKPEGPADLVLLAKRQTCDRFYAVRTVKGKNEPMPDIRRLCLEILTELREEQWLRACETLMQTPDTARERVLQMLAVTPASQAGVIGGRPASEVLREHLAGLGLPELAIVACSLRPTMACWVMNLWLRVAGGEIAPTAKAVA